VTKNTQIAERNSRDAQGVLQIDTVVTDPEIFSEPHRHLLAQQAQALVKSGWIRNLDEIVAESLRRYVESHQETLTEAMLRVLCPMLRHQHAVAARPCDSLPCQTL
jgi:hypothetical protein